MSGQLSRLPVALYLGVVFAAAGCSADKAADRPPRQTTGTVPRSTAATGSAPTGPTQTAPPPDASAIPNGVYRTQIGTDELVAAGVDDPGNAGVFTLTVKSGTYTLGCVPAPGTACGDTAPRQRQYVDVGSLRGTGRTVWFVPDTALKSSLTGCVRHSSAESGCGPEGPYRFTWAVAANGLTFRDFVGLGDQTDLAGGYVNFTFKPWRRIA